MTVSVRHSTVVVVADDGTSPVGSNEWNDDHVVPLSDTGEVESGTSDSGLITPLRLTGLIADTGEAMAGTDHRKYITPYSLGAALDNRLTKALAVSATGTNISTDIVTSSGRLIYDIYQTPAGSSITVQTIAPHGYTTGQDIRVRVDGGMNSVTNRAHPADGDWTVTVTDDFKFVLDGSTYASSVFLRGRCFDVTDLVDASAELNRLSTWVSENGGGQVLLPAGMLYIQSDKVRVASGVRFIGRGESATFLAITDYDTGDPVSHVIGTDGNASYWSMEDFTVCGNRGHQKLGAGQHSIDLGDDSDTGNAMQHWTIRNVTNAGSAGYGLSYGGHNSKQYGTVENFTSIFSDNDGIDCKNRNEDNAGLTVRGMTVRYHGMGEQGTDLKPAVALTNNPITTDTGATTITIPATDIDDTQKNDIVTITGAATVAGNDYNGSWPVTAATSSLVTLETGLTPSSSTSGGGAGVSVYAPKISIGAVGIDMRGLLAWDVSNLYVEGPMYGRNGLRQRGGVAGDSNGEGGTGCNINGLRVRDIGPGNDMRSGMSLDGVGANATNIQVYGTGRVSAANGNSGIVTQSSCKYAKISNFEIHDICTALRSRGEDCKYITGLIKNSLERGVYEYGENAAVEVEMDDNPFTTTLGSTTVLCAVFNHGHNNGDDVSFSGQDNNFNGITILGSNDGSYTVANKTDDTFEITVVDTATASGTGGGDTVTAIFDGAAHNTLRNTYAFVETLQSIANTAIGFDIGSRADGTKFVSCRDVSSTTPYSQSASALNILWSAGNTGGLPGNGDRITPRVTTITSGATPTVNSDTTDLVNITALNTAITSMTTNLSGTPTNGQELRFRIKDNGTNRAITWGASFEARGVALPTTTTANKRLTTTFEYDTVAAKWGCIASVVEA